MFPFNFNLSERGGRVGEDPGNEVVLVLLLHSTIFFLRILENEILYLLRIFSVANIRSQRVCRELRTSIFYTIKGKRYVNL